MERPGSDTASNIFVSGCYQAKPDFLLREIAGEHILIPVGATAMKVHGMISLSESGLLLWNQLQEACSEDTLVDSLLKEYDIDRETAAQDVHTFLEKMKQVGLLAEGESGAKE